MLLVVDKEHLKKAFATVDVVLLSFLSKQRKPFWDDVQAACSALSQLVHLEDVAAILFVYPEVYKVQWIVCAGQPCRLLLEYNSNDKGYRSLHLSRVSSFE